MSFQKDDIAHLFAQRTTENGQQITQEALDYVFEVHKQIKKSKYGSDLAYLV